MAVVVVGVHFVSAVESVENEAWSWPKSWCLIVVDGAVAVVGAIVADF